MSDDQRTIASDCEAAIVSEMRRIFAGTGGMASGGQQGERLYARAAAAAISVIREHIASLRQWHIDDHGDAECMTTREIAYNEVLVALDAPNE